MSVDMKQSYLSYDSFEKVLCQEGASSCIFLPQMKTVKVNSISEDWNSWALSNLCMHWLAHIKMMTSVIINSMK